MPSNRQLAAIMFTDIVGYTTVMGEDEEKAFALLRKNRQVQRPLVEKYNGKWLKEIGDGVLASFTTVTDAVYCAKAIQEACMKEDNLKLRIGIHQGEVVFEGDDVFGDGVNIASRIETLAPTGGIWVSEAVERNIQNKKGIETRFIREENLKNVKSPVKIYQVKVEGAATPNPTESSKEHLPISESTKQASLLPRNLFFIFLAVIIVISLLYFLYPKPGSNIATNQPSNPGINKLTIAVLPFSNTRPNPETDYLGFAIANQVIGELDYLKNILVRPSASIRKYSGKIIDPNTVGDDLSVEYLVIGNYLNEDENIRLTIELVELKTNEILWREEIGVSFNNAFELQDIVAQKVVDGLNVKLTPKEINRISKDISSNPIAYDYYLKGISYPLSIEGDRLSVEMLLKSIELDSNYAPTYSHLAFRTQSLSQFDLQGPVLKIEAENYYLKALSINGDLLSAQADLAILFVETNRIDKAINLARQMVEINPNNAVAHFSLSYIYRYGGMLKEAVEELEKAVTLDPKNPRFRRLGLAYLQIGNYKKASEIFNMDKGSAYSLSWQGDILVRQGKNDQALVYFERIISSHEEGLWVKVAIVDKALIQNNPELGLQKLNELEEANISDGEAWYYWASKYALLNNNEGFIRGLKRAVATGYFNYPFMLTDTYIDSMRDDPEFQKILAQAKAKHEAFKEKFF